MGSGGPLDQGPGIRVPRSASGIGQRTRGHRLGRVDRGDARLGAVGSWLGVGVTVGDCEGAGVVDCEGAGVTDGVAGGVGVGPGGDGSSRVALPVACLAVTGYWVEANRIDEVAPPTALTLVSPSLAVQSTVQVVDSPLARRATAVHVATTWRPPTVTVIVGFTSRWVTPVLLVMVNTALAPRGQVLVVVSHKVTAVSSAFGRRPMLWNCQIEVSLWSSGGCTIPSGSAHEVRRWFAPLASLVVTSRPGGM